ncbi:MAG: phycobilisome linker polypeptide [Synechococcus sp.]
MNISSSNQTGSYGNRSVSIEISGLCNNDISHTSNYTIKVPFSRMSRTMQGINRMGAKVVGVSVGGSSSASHSSSSSASSSEAED